MKQLILIIVGVAIFNFVSYAVRAVVKAYKKADDSTMWHILHIRSTPGQLEETFEPMYGTFSEAVKKARAYKTDFTTEAIYVIGSGMICRITKDTVA